MSPRHVAAIERHPPKPLPGGRRPLTPSLAASYISPDRRFLTAPPPRPHKETMWKLASFVQKTNSDQPKTPRLSLTQHPLQPSLHRRPFLIDNAEINRMPNAPALRHHVLAKRALLHSSQPQNRAPRALVQRVCLQLHAVRPQRFERMPQHQVLRFGVDRSSLPQPANPRPADFDAPVQPVDVAKSRAPDSTPGCAVDHSERQRRAFRLRAQRQFDVSAHIGGRAHLGRNPAPQFLVQTHRAQIGVVIEREGFQPHVAAFQCHSFYIHPISNGSVSW
jgi:hypothetical protein